ncbi:PLP-dependent transferase, partial [bacterium]
TPIYQASTFALEGLESDPAYMYTRYQNPNRAQLEATIAALEGARFGHCYASGMAAIHAAFGTLKAGDHLLAASDLYGGTMNLIRSILAPAGIEWSLFDPMTTGSLTKSARPNTKIAVYESPTNPTLKVCDIAAVASEATALGIRTVFDNTFASPALQNPLGLGVDVVVHSSTKYLGGHSDITGGALVTDDEAISAEAFTWLINSGASPSPFECWLTHRGIKTLGLRVAKHCANAQAVAEFLVKHPRVVRVNYPGLTSHVGHDLASRQMNGFGGMMSVVFDSVETAQQVVGALRIWTFAPSLGGVESLIGYPARMSHAGLTPQEREEAGIPDSLLRLSVGIEDPDDLIEDLDRALR